MLDPPLPLKLKARLCETIHYLYVRSIHRRPRRDRRVPHRTVAGRDGFVIVHDRFVAL